MPAGDEGHVRCRLEERIADLLDIDAVVVFAVERFVRPAVANDARAIAVEQIGHYDPKKNPADVKIDRERVDYWVSKGAQLSPTVKSLLKKK